MVVWVPGGMTRAPTLTSVQPHLGRQRGDVDFGIAAIDHGERVADLRTAGDVAKIVSPLGEDRRNPVGGSRPGGRRETQRQTQNEQERSHRGHSLSPSRTGSTLSAEPLQTGTMIPQESAAVIPLVIECGFF